MAYEADSFNRLVIGIMEKDRCTPEAALEKLSGFTIRLEAGEEIKSAAALQAAFLTAVNTAKRAFLGGVVVELPDGDFPSLLPSPEQLSFRSVVNRLGGDRLLNGFTKTDFSLYFGKEARNDGLEVVANSWQGGVIADGMGFRPKIDHYQLPLGGIYAGALAVGMAFFSVTGIHSPAADHSKGLSLWRPDLKWDAVEAAGPAIELLPKRYWLLGLGHLGQAYLWCIGMLPYQDRTAVEFVLQDYDKVTPANNSAGLLCEPEFDKVKKTRMCTEWLENMGFETTICERKYNADTKLTDEEPRVALCGFDSAKSRALLSSAGFDLVVEASLGAKLNTFDNIILHTFPAASQTPMNIWGTADDEPEINETVLAALQKTDKETCGIVPLTIAGKAMSSSFVGACAGTLAIAELIRGLHGGKRYEKIAVQLRVSNQIKAVIHPNVDYSIELAVNGYVSVQKETLLC